MNTSFPALLFLFSMAFLSNAIYSTKILVPRSPSSSSSAFDPMSFLVDPNETTVSLDFSSPIKHSGVSSSRKIVNTESPSNSPAILSSSQRARKTTLRQMSGQELKEYKKERYQKAKASNELKSSFEKAKMKEIKNQKSQIYRQRMKSCFGYTSKFEAQLAEIKDLVVKGTASDEQKMKLQSAMKKKREARLKFSDKKRKQGFKRTTKGWIKDNASE